MFLIFQVGKILILLSLYLKVRNTGSTCIWLSFNEVSSDKHSSIKYFTKCVSFETKKNKCDKSCSNMMDTETATVLKGVKLFYEKSKIETNILVLKFEHHYSYFHHFLSIINLSWSIESSVRMSVHI